MIWYVTNEGENSEGLSQLLQNKLYRGVTILSCLFVVAELDDVEQCGLWLGWTSERFWPLWLHASQKWGEDASVAGDAFFHLVCSAVCSPSTEGDTAQSHLWWCLTQGSHYMSQRFHRVFLCLCLPHSHTQVLEELGFALVREEIMDPPLIFCTPGQAVEVWGQGLALCLLCPHGAASVAGQHLGGTALHCCVWLYTCPKALHHLEGRNWDMCPTVCTRNISSLQEQQQLSSVHTWDVWGDTICVSPSQKGIWQTFHLERDLGAQKYKTKKLNSHCLLATIKLLSNACARMSLCANQRLYFWRGKQANKHWPCQWLERDRQVLWSSLISPCWCLTATAAWLCVCVQSVHCFQLQVCRIFQALPEKELYFLCLCLWS